MIPAANSAVLNPPGDRGKIKDKILESISKAVKKIQELLIKEDTLILSHENKFLHQLCEHLDHAFLFGLRHITNGYWRAVKEFTRKETVKQIQNSKHVHTNLGRGRAWLYLALNENCLESYLHCFKDNPNIVNKHYVSRAIMMDQQWLHVVITLMSGLEFVFFSLSIDVYYLDISAYPPCRVSEAIQEEDRISHCSMDSSTSSQISMLGISRSLPDGDSSSQTMDSSTDSLVFRPMSQSFTEDYNTVPNRTGQHMSAPVRSRCHSFGLLDNRITRIVNISVNSSNDVPDNTNLEVIHIPKTRAIKKKKKSVSETNGDLYCKVDKDDINSEHSRTESTSEEDAFPLICDITEENSLLVRSTQFAIDEINVINKISEQSKSSEYLKIDEKHFHPKTLNNPFDSNEWILKTDLSFERPGPEGKEANESCVNNCSELDAVTNSPVLSNAADLESSVYDDLERFKLCSLNVVPEIEESPICDTKPSCQKQSNDLEILHSVQRIRRLSSHEMEVDNNTLLVLSLNFFQNQEEQFYKMYHATTGHTEGEIVTLFLVLTNRTLYLLNQGSNQHQFTLNDIIHYNELDFISLSLNFQSINLVCVNRRRQFWICTGDELLSRSIISSLEVAIRRNPKVTLPSVLTDATTQKLSLRKWIAKELQKEPTDVEIHHYILIHWEDSEETPEKQDGQDPCREGFLMCRFNQSSLFNGSTWKPGYLSLKNGILFKFMDQNDKEPKFTIHLRGQGCSGCRRSQSSDRPHTLELILSDNSVLQLAAANEQDASDWLQAFLQTVSQGNAVCTHDRWLCCCLVLTNQKLFMCHEELQTGFIRILGSANLSDITGITCDSDVKSYCIIEFESMEACISSGEWIIYFNADYEQEKFITILSKLWSDIFKVSLSVSEIEDLTLKAQCQLGIRQIQSNWESPDAWLHRLYQTAWI